LTGGYCAGKSSAAAALKGAGWSVVDVDGLGHAALERSKDAVAALLGPSALKADGSPDRRAIAALVFADPGALARYEAVVHPAMNALVAEALEGELAAAAARTPRAEAMICVDAALLYRLPVASACDAVIEVRAPLCSRILRGRARDGLGTRAVLARIARQRPLWVAGRAFADKTFVARNHGSKARFHSEILAAASRALSERADRRSALGA